MANGGLDSLWHVDDDLHQIDLVVDQAKQLDCTGTILVYDVLQNTIIVGNN
jgi:hypothetical protein